MADISQIKLPNGDTFDLVDEKSGYNKIHYVEVTYSESDEELVANATYQQIGAWIETNDLVIVQYNNLNYYFASNFIDGSNIAYGFNSNDGTHCLSICFDRITLEEPPIAGVPSGGTTGQALVKLSDNDYDYDWGELNIPTKTSHLTNDSGYLTLSTLPIYDGTVV